MEPLKRCVNGCARPPKPPSKVICGECLGQIKKNLKGISKDLRYREEMERQSEQAEADAASLVGR